MKNHVARKQMVPQQESSLNSPKKRNFFTRIYCYFKTIREIRRRRFEKMTVSPYSKFATFFFCLFGGPVGLHRMYVRRYVTAFLMIITLGGGGIWIIIDLIRIRKNKFKDWHHLPVSEIRRPKDKVAVFFSLLSVVLARFVYPAAFDVLLQVGTWGGEEIGIFSRDERREIIQKLKSKHGEVQTNIPVPKIPDLTDSKKGGIN